MNGASPVIETRLKHLESHLEQENPVLLNTVQSFRELDEVAHDDGAVHPGTVVRHPDSRGGR
jgi:demethoxyubiquinone hydroxylase (CLK1/Coq7/Cat5 family)